MQVISNKKVLAWQDMLVNDFFRRVREKLNHPGAKGTEYSTKEEHGIEDTKITQIPVTGFGSTRERDILSENNPANPPDPGSGYDKDVELGDGRANDETGPGNSKVTPETDPEITQIIFENPITISNLFHAESDELDSGSRFLRSLYNKEPVRWKHKIVPVK